ncbi:putative WD repeat-containing protein alr3466 [Nostoc sp, PCC 7120] [Rhizoctonia solani]|uniref:Putative WD repeat-containing protein alr3466 [Nostoc sp, PCC 7120] n=1 Tax=Rhizoctonia solani TaxID=456999 RepID=A0A0K6FP25_9AGAM|nr:putative WD repeat-containing protein alr3466 [Nostoc sp, PCC 7120] [Rhizoctonia solani]
MIIHEGHTEAVSSIAFSPDGNSVVYGSDDSCIRMWDAHGSSPISEPLKVDSGWIHSVSYSPLGDFVACGLDFGSISLWDAHASQQLHCFCPNDHHDHPIYSIAFSPDAKLIASAGGFSISVSHSFAVKLWDVERRKSISRPFKGHTAGVRSVQFSPDGSQVISGSCDNTIRVWDIERRTTTVGPITGHTNWVRSIALPPDGSQMVSGSFDRTLRLWDTRTGGLIGNAYEGHARAIRSVAFSPRGTYVLSGGDDSTVRLWDVRIGREVQQFNEHTKGVRSVAFSPCGQSVASASYDGKAIIRGISYDYPKSTDGFESYVITSHMSLEQMFDCLIASGCVDLTSQMDTKQEAAIILSGGGFGDIWQGKLYNGRKVAIKAWRTNTLESCSYKTLKRAARELYYWSRMEHPNIHRLWGVIMFRDQYLGMVSRWMNNGNLHEYLRKCPSADRHQLCIHVASRLEYMHSCNTVHGDLKAANVLVSPDGVAKLSDFDFSIMSGVSSLVFSETSNSRSGSLRWAAPELLLEIVRNRTTQSDVYALGMTMLEIFSGDVPYSDCRTDIGVIRAVERGALPSRPMEQLQNNWKGESMWKLLLQCWTREYNDRPSSEQVVDMLTLYVCKE